MLPFLVLPQIVVNNENEEKTLDTRIQPEQICNYYPGFYRGTIVNLKSRGSMLIDMNVGEVDSALAAYHDAVKARPGEFGNMNLSRPKPIIHEAD